MGTAGPRKTVLQPAASANRRKFKIPATWTHSPRAAATTVLPDWDIFFIESNLIEIYELY